MPTEPRDTVAERREPAASSSLPFVLVHGAWHGAWAYERVIPALAAHGHAAVARDLPAHGVNARFPASFAKRPLDAAAFASEPSPVAGTTLDDYVDHVLRTVDQARALGHERVVLVGHSMGGLAITMAAERAPEKIAKLVYLAAFMPTAGTKGLDYVRAPENRGEMLGPLMMASPKATGALRMDPRSDDPAYRAAAKRALCDDASDADHAAVGHLLGCDVPAAPFAACIETTAARWGALERHYIKCLRDKVLLPALQQRFIDEADALAPGNRTHVHTLDSSHSPFIAHAGAVADTLAAIARG
ncbi:alpha/beta hydrolase [Burkholderia pseudomallei]|uniref:alpha/beta hydrolase n=1 Tax=Burkholderia pseudomallei TaxID=28450 RepID=UPI0003A06981|nr:alpha/beta hydrolase [Burkholderia pseudomallei]KGX77687.1 cholesterol acyltransferase family protein [Burkholderia pseudomallei MSHR435]AIP44567.1 cholesterol acyltransferase family protein [Burkholderia pseudomallei MSHR5858]AIP56228.1 cholesterol acyltransferase family protein [Burkholderia pseudomallei HBPUB10303a]AJW57209.1 peptidase M13 [Burkholderia pseudomallei]AJX18381.1 cholesterol acyltransferase family protein [Burkholderia pseudomallei MSHR491]